MLFDSAYLPDRKPNERLEIDWSDPINQGRVGCWLLGDNGLIRDLCGHNHGVNVGAARDLGRTGSGHRIASNSANRINLGTISTNSPLQCTKNNQFSIFAHLHVSLNNGNDFGRIFDKSNAGNASGGFAMYVDSATNEFVVQTNFTGGHGKFNFINPLDQSDTLAVTYDGSAQTARGYHGGRLAGSAAVTNNVPSVFAPAAIGNWNHTSGRQYQSPIYQVSVWDRVLSEHENARIGQSPYVGLKPARQIFLVPDPVAAPTFTEVSASGSANAVGSASASTVTPASASGSAVATGSATASIQVSDPLLTTAVKIGMKVAKPRVGIKL